MDSPPPLPTPPPCSIPCEKCGSTDIARRWREKGEKREYRVKVKKRRNAFVEVMPIRSTALQECITHLCNVCGFAWETSILEQPKAGA
jgi:hypothetical protein